MQGRPDAGVEFGRYRLRELLGHGGMGEVFVAYDTHKDCDVALKRLKREYAEDRDFQARFRREAQLAARLREPHVIPIHDYGEIDGQLYIEMRLVDGVDLEHVLQRDRITPQLMLDVLAQTAAALDAAHAAGLVHRDVKPSNIVLTGDPDRGGYFAYLVDFGVARPLLGHGGSKITTTIGTVGTVAYLAPERIEGLTGDRRADVYSLACVLFECLTGRSPFVGEPVAVLFAHVHKPVPNASELVPGLPPAIDGVIAKGMAKRAEDRYDSASDLIAAARVALSGVSTAPPARASDRPGDDTVVVTPPPVHADDHARRLRDRVAIPALAFVVAGAVCGVLAFTALRWFHGSDGIFGSITPRSTFSKLHDEAVQDLPTELGGSHVDFGISKIYFGGLAWAALIAAVALGIAAALPLRRGARAVRIVAGAMTLIGLGLTLWAIRLVSFDQVAADYYGDHTPGYGGWVAHMGLGAWLAVAAFVLIGVGIGVGNRATHHARAAV